MAYANLTCSGITYTVYDKIIYMFSGKADGLRKPAIVRHHPRKRKGGGRGMDGRRTYGAAISICV